MFFQKNNILDPYLTLKKTIEYKITVIIIFIKLFKFILSKKSGVKISVTNISKDLDNEYFFVSKWCK